MISSILNCISSIGSAVGSVFKWRTEANVQRRAAEADVAAKQAELKAKTDQIKEAVYKGDDARLNKIVSGLPKSVAISAVIGVLIGCHTEPFYIPTDRKIESCTNSLGIACKAVPDAVFVEMLELIQRLNDIETEAAVDKRLKK